jgi:hypothetical protein
LSWPWESSSLLLAPVTSPDSTHLPRVAAALRTAATIPIAATTAAASGWSLERLDLAETSSSSRNSGVYSEEMDFDMDFERMNIKQLAATSSASLVTPQCAQGLQSRLPPLGHAGCQWEEYPKSHHPTCYCGRCIL